MRKFINILEAEDDEFDYGHDIDDDFDSRPLAKPQPYQFLGHLDRYKAQKHDARMADRLAWRKQQRKRMADDERDAENTEYMSKRSIQKNLVGYKPFKFPLIRFGKFGSRSRNFLDAEMRQEMGNVTHEVGVSAYLGMPYKDGWSFDLPHPDRASYNAGAKRWDSSYSPTEAELKQLWNYIQHGTPMDIFLLRGHLVSYGRSNDWLNLGADGEYLLDTSKPYQQEILSPEKVYPSDRNLVQSILSRFKNGIDGLRDQLEEWNNESLEEGVAYRDESLIVLSDPTKTQFANLMRKSHSGLRGLIDEFGKLYVWDAYYANHDEIAPKLGTNDDISLHLHPNANYVEFDGATFDTEDDEEFLDQLLDKVKRNSCLQRLYGAKFKVLLALNMIKVWR